MKELIRFEINKNVRKPIVLAVYTGVIIINILMVFLGTFGSEPTYGLPYSSEKVMQLKQEQSDFSGVIGEQWIQGVEDRKNTILKDPANQVDQEERQRIIEELLAQGLSIETINSNNQFFVREDVLNSREFQRLEDPEVASNFYRFADRMGKGMVEYYSETYDGQKGRALASKAEEMYSYLSNEYEAYYDYNWGWSRLHAMQTVFPFTIGLFLIVVLAPMFSYEYSKRTDSLLLSAKYGRNKVIKAKIITGFLIAILLWLFIQLINIVTIFSFFGIEGWNSFVQNWAVNPSPYAFTYLSSYLAVTAMSFVGLLFLTSMILFISSRSKTSFRSLIISAIITLLPTAPFTIYHIRAAHKFLMFLPTNVLIGIHHFKTFEAFYFFGKVIMLPSAVMIVAIILSILMVIGAYFTFKRHQTEN